VLRKRGIAPGGDGGQNRLVLQSAAVDRGRDMIFHGRQKSCREKVRETGGNINQLTFFYDAKKLALYMPLCV